jgi:hypothetical protein
MKSSRWTSSSGCAARRAPTFKLDSRRPGVARIRCESAGARTGGKGDAGHGALSGLAFRQYLAFIYAYTRLHRRPPAEADMQQYFRVSPPSVHQMVLTLERAGFIRRQPGVARNIEILVDQEHLPVLR